jgi:Flp pilus assembly protein TadG
MAEPRGRRLRGERGNVSLFVVLMLPALVLAAGLVLDGGRQIQERREAHGIAAEAARAAAQMSEQEAFAGVLDPARAADRAQQALAERGAIGAVAVQGAVITVTVARSIDYVILPGEGQVTQAAAATAVDGVTGGAP